MLTAIISIQEHVLVGEITFIVPVRQKKSLHTGSDFRLLFVIKVKPTDIIVATPAGYNNLLQLNKALFTVANVLAVM